MRTAGLVAAFMWVAGCATTSTPTGTTAPSPAIVATRNLKERPISVVVVDLHPGVQDSAQLVQATQRAVEKKLREVGMTVQDGSAQTLKVGVDYGERIENGASLSCARFTASLVQVGAEYAPSQQRVGEHCAAEATPHAGADAVGSAIALVAYAIEQLSTAKGNPRLANAYGVALQRLLEQLDRLGQ